jgi:hypothetical protein
MKIFDSSLSKSEYPSYGRRKSFWMNMNEVCIRPLEQQACHWLSTSEESYPNRFLVPPSAVYRGAT